MTHLFDTTAVLALVLGESGSKQVQALFEDHRTRAVVSVLAKAEIWARLKSLGREADFEDEWKILLSLFDAVLPVDEKVVDQSITLRLTSAGRLPLIDSLIAATAASHGLVLVHRDAHMRTIPRAHLKQLDLAAGGNI